ncbi:MAG: hypothetical protein AAB706_01580 [Patescibacteria group bacterium]
MTKLTQEQFDQLKQKGLSDSQIQVIGEKRGFELPKQPSAVGGFIKGVAKGFVGDIARPTAQLLQGTGQRILAAIDPTKNLEEIQSETGFKSLDDRTPEGQSVAEALKTRGASETTGRVAINIASFFIPTAPAVQVAGRVVSTAGRVATRAGIGLSAKEAPLVQAYKARYSVPQRILAALTGKVTGKPITNAETALRQNIFGTETMIGVQSRRAATNIWSKILSPALDKSSQKVNMSSFIDDMAKQIDEIPELTRKSELQQALNAFKDDYGKVGEVSVKKLQQFKEGWAKFLPDKVYKGKPIASSFKEIQAMAASQARTIIYKALEGVEGKAAYFDYGNLKNLQEMGQKAMTGSKLKGGAGSFISGIYDKVITPIATTGGLTLYRTGEGIEFVGRQGVKILGHLFR